MSRVSDQLIQQQEIKLKYEFKFMEFVYDNLVSSKLNHFFRGASRKFSIFWINRKRSESQLPPQTDPQVSALAPRDQVVIEIAHVGVNDFLV